MNETVKQINLSYQHPKDRWHEFLGVKLDEKSFDTLLQESADVYTPEGEILCRFRKAVIPSDQCLSAYGVLKTIKHKAKNRGLANGRLFLDYIEKNPYIRSDGTKSKTKYNAFDKLSGIGMSGIIGYMDRYPRIPFCRETSFTANHKDKWVQCLPFIKSVNDVYAQVDPDRYAKQKEVVDKTSKDFVIKDTVFTTITVNQTFQTAVHEDAGDLKVGLSVICALKTKETKGGYLVFPHYRVAVDLDTADVLCFNSHHMHGNTTIYGKTGMFHRTSVVLYYRENMINCGSAEQELMIAKKRKLNQPLKAHFSEIEKAQNE